jgi:hypothetical protein
MAGGCISAVSRKQELATKSSTEAELVAIADMSNNILWLRQMLIEMGYEQGATKILEDNVSTIALLTNGVTHRQSTRHVNMRYFFIRDRIKSGEIALEHIPGLLQVADMMTKQIDGAQLQRLCSQIMTI